MSGHSKWNNIQHRKGAQDRKRAKLFTKFGRELTIAAKEGGETPASIRDYVWQLKKQRPETCQKIF